MSQKPRTYDTDTIKRLFERLRTYEITKGEMVMIMNLRPTNVPALNTVLEDMEDRFNADEQEDIVNGVAEVLGAFPPKSDGQADQDEVMESTETAR